MEDAVAAEHQGEEMNICIIYKTYMCGIQRARASACGPESGGSRQQIYIIIEANGNETERISHDFRKGKTRNQTLYSVEKSVYRRSRLAQGHKGGTPLFFLSAHYMANPWIPG